jgi:alanine dehydrogenase
VPVVLGALVALAAGHQTQAQNAQRVRWREDLMAAGVTAIAYETVTSPQGTLPLLTPMSEVAGRMAPHVGAHCLEKGNGGRGVLLGGVPGVPAASVVILGGGVAGTTLLEDSHLRDGLSVHGGKITYCAVAKALKLPYAPADDALRV